MYKHARVHEKKFATAGKRSASAPCNIRECYLDLINTYEDGHSLIHNSRISGFHIDANCDKVGGLFHISQMKITTYRYMILFHQSQAPVEKDLSIPVDDEYVVLILLNSSSRSVFHFALFLFSPSTTRTIYIYVYIYIYIYMMYIYIYVHKHHYICTYT